jgi:hypothetical protein
MLLRYLEYKRAKRTASAPDVMHSRFVLRILHPCANLGCWLALVIAVPEVVDACAASTLLVLGSGGFIKLAIPRCLRACVHSLGSSEEYATCTTTGTCTCSLGLIRGTCTGRQVVISDVP